MKTYAVFFGITLLLSMNAAWADCPSPADIVIEIKPVFGALIYDFSYDVPAIQEIADNVVHKVREGWALGLTRYEPVLEMTAPISVAAAPKGRFCARPDHITINLGYKDMTIMVADELPGDSCGFDRVLRHEEEHVEVEKQVLNEYMPLIRKKFRAYLSQNGVVQSATANTAVALQRTMLRATLIGAAAEMQSETAARQRNIDSPEEYNRLLHVCDGQLAELVESARRERIFAQRF